MRGVFCPAWKMPNVQEEFKLKSEQEIIDKLKEIELIEKNSDADAVVFASGPYGAQLKVELAEAKAILNWVLQG